jgi:hypothetical protein
VVNVRVIAGAGRMPPPVEKVRLIEGAEWKLPPSAPPAPAKEESRGPEPDAIVTTPRADETSATSSPSLSPDAGPSAPPQEGWDEDPSPLDKRKLRSCCTKAKFIVEDLNGLLEMEACYRYPVKLRPVIKKIHGLANYIEDWAELKHPTDPGKVLCLNLEPHITSLESEADKPEGQQVRGELAHIAKAIRDELEKFRNANNSAETVRDRERVGAHPAPGQS